MLTRAQQDAIEWANATTELDEQYLAEHGPVGGVESLVAKRFAENFPRREAEYRLGNWSKSAQDVPLTAAEIAMLIARFSSNPSLFAIAYAGPQFVPRVQYCLPADPENRPKWERVPEGEPGHFDAVATLEMGSYRHWLDPFRSSVYITEPRNVLESFEAVCGLVADWVAVNRQFVDRAYVGAEPRHPEEFPVARIVVAQEPEPMNEPLIESLRRLRNDVAKAVPYLQGLTGFISNRHSEIDDKRRTGIWSMVDEGGLWDLRYESRRIRAFSRNANSN